MEIKVYVDVLFLINFIFDYLLLWMTGLLCQNSSGILRLLTAALLGALYAVCIFFLPITFLSCLPFKLLIGSLMVVVAFQPRRFRLLVQYSCIFYLISTLLGGAAFNFFYFSDQASTFGAVTRNGTLYINIPTYQLLLLALITMPIMKIAFHCGRRMTAKTQNITPISVLYQGKILKLRGFYDSGNLLQDALTEKSVIITEWSRAKHLFPGCKHPEDANLTPISFHTLTKDGILYAFLPDAIYIEKKHTKTQTETVYIGLIDRTLNYHQKWDAILPHDFEGENHHETMHFPKTVDCS